MAASEDAMAAAAERAAERQVAAAERQAAAMAAQRAAAEEAARAQGDLMVKMSGATEEMFKQEIFQQIDPAALGVEAYANLGVELGLIDERAAGLMEAVGPMVDALEKGIVPTENAAAAISELYAAADQAVPPIEAILDKYAAAPGLIGPSLEAQENLNERLRRTGEVGPEAETAIEGFTGQIQIAKTPVVDLKTASGELGDELERLARTWEINVVTTFSQQGTPPSTPAGTPGLPHMQHGGIVPGRIGQAIPIIAHGGEVVLNPYQAGALGGPGGPPASSVSYGGDTIVNNFFNPQAAAIERERQRQRRMARLSQRM